MTVELVIVLVGSHLYWRAAQQTVAALSGVLNEQPGRAWCWFHWVIREGWLAMVTRAATFFTKSREPCLSARLHLPASFSSVAIWSSKSYTHSVSVKDYLVKRFLRIWPGYAVAFLISLLVVAPLGGAKLADINVLRNVSYFLTFQAPCVDRVFDGLSVEKVNGSLWTISYEVRCYVLVILLGACGFLRDRRKFLAWTVCLGLAVFLPLSIKLPFSRVFGALSSDVLLIGLFCAGGVFYLYRDRIRFRVGYAVIALLLWLALQVNVTTAEIALMTAGAYILFYVATRKGDNLIGRLPRRLTFPMASTCIPTPFSSSFCGATGI